MIFGDSLLGNFPSGGLYIILYKVEGNTKQIVEYSCLYTTVDAIYYGGRYDEMFLSVTLKGGSMLFRYVRAVALVLIIVPLVITACGRFSSSANISSPVAGAPAAGGGDAAAAADFMVMATPVASQFAMAAPAAEAPAAPGALAAQLPAPVVVARAAMINTGASVAANSDRRIIKQADVALLVADTDVAINRITQTAADAGGYLLSSQSWIQAVADKEYKYASLTLSIPADQFEQSLNRVREVAVQILRESSAGEDVTDQFVDLESELINLKATRDRIRGFLERTKTVEEALKVNEQLSAVESKIETTQGRMNYLAGRSTFSTIVITLEPQIPPTPEPTPSPTATPTPTPTPERWQPMQTFSEASVTLRSTYQTIFDLLIWFGVVIVPIGLPVVLIGWLITRLVWRRRG